MIKEFGGINIASKNPKELVSFYKDILGIPVIRYDISEYDGVLFGFIENAPVFCIWDEKNGGMQETVKDMSVYFFIVTITKKLMRN